MVLDSITYLTICSGLSSLIARTFVSPIDKYIIAQQTNLNLQKQKTIRYIFKGNIYNNIRVLSNNIIELTLFDILKHRKDDKKLYIFYSMIVSIISNTLTFPLDTIRIKHVCDLPKYGTLKQYYNGFTISLFGYSVYSSIRLGLFNIMKTDNHIINIINATFVTLIALSVGFPLEVIKRQKQITNKKYLDIRKQLILTKQMYSGYKLSLYKNIPLNVLVLNLNEYFKRIFNKNSW